MVTTRSFVQVDVFGAEQYAGNPVAVVLDGTGLSTEEMQRFAAWTNLSETTFVLPPESPDGDYRLRIFTPAAELPFAGHPTLGSAHAWLEAGGAPRDGRVVQECGVGQVHLHGVEGALAFRAPPLLRTGPVEDDVLSVVMASLGVAAEDVIGHQWVDNGAGWVAVRLGSAEAVLALEPDLVQMGELMVGVVGDYPPGAEHRYEVRAFAPSDGIPEDPVTGSLNAALAQWLVGTGAAPASYTASQGARVRRRGVVQIDARDDGVWVGGSTTTCIRGAVTL